MSLDGFAYISPDYEKKMDKYNQEVDKKIAQLLEMEEEYQWNPTPELHLLMKETAKDLNVLLAYPPQNEGRAN